VITDVSMPGMNGIDLAIAVRERFASCKVLLFSGHAASTNLMAEARAKGYDFELLTKPVHPRDLLERLNRDLLERQNEAPQQKSALSGFEFDELVKHQRLILKART
jgi:DNA-binding NtrC family response regulator